LASIRWHGVGSGPGGGSWRRRSRQVAWGHSLGSESARGLLFGGNSGVAVAFQMVIEKESGAKSAIAFSTRIRLLSRVDRASVSRKVVTPTERSFAIIALVWSLVTVDPLVFRKGATLSERNLAVVAFIRPLPSVDLLVFRKVATVTERSLAVVAFKRSLPSVDSHMPCKITGPSKSFPTFSTNMRALISRFT
jgi:hypothetical protein